MAMAPEHTPSSTPADFGEKVSISQLILSRLDDMRHDQDIMRQDTKQEMTSLRQELTALRQELRALDTKFDKKISDLDIKFDQKLSTLAYWYWGTLVLMIVGFVTVLFTHA
jgi:hypothetical protein